MTVAGSALKRQITEKLTERLFGCRPDVQTWPNRDDYVLRAEDVLVDGVWCEKAAEVKSVLAGSTK